MNDEDAGGVTDAAFAALDEEALVALAMGLTDVPSLAGYEEEAARFLYGHMQELGMISRLQQVAPGRYNALGIHEGSGGGRTLMFNGHLETGASAGDESSAPTARLLDSEWLCGPGIWNMKASLAAYVTAIAAIRQAGVELVGDVLVAAVAGAWEDSPVDKFQGGAYYGFGFGTKHLIAHGGVADMCVIGEPTSLKLVKRHFGTTGVHIDVEPRLVTEPVSRPVVDDLTVSSGTQPSTAVEHAAEIVRALREWTPDYQRRNTVDGTVPQVTVAAIEGGDPCRASARPERCSVFVGVRTPPEALPITVKHEIRQVLADVRQVHPEIEARVEPYVTNPGTSVPDDSSIVQAVRASHAAVVGKEPDEAVVTWHSDAPHLNRYGMPSVNYGPAGRIMPDGEQQVRISDLVTCTRVYIDLILRVCAS